jgi:probable HAF family extracellular repeat protein
MQSVRLALLIFVSSPGSAMAATPAYELTWLPSLGGGGGSVASDINDAGEIVGRSRIAGNGAVHATWWTVGSAAVDLAPSGGTTFATHINDGGQIIGEYYANPSSAGSQGEGQALLWQSAPSSPTLLAPLPGSQTTEASGINDSGRIVGTSYDNSPGAVWAPTPTSWNPATAIQTSANRAYAQDINASGAIVGLMFDVDSGNNYPVVWNNGQRTSLADLPGTFSVSLLHINDSGLIAGTTWIDVPSQHSADLSHNQATLWNGSTVTALPSLDPLNGLDSVAIDLNNGGDVVGWSVSSQGAHATLWDDGVPVDLNSFLGATDRLAGWTLLEATAINDLGWIVGDAVNWSTGQSEAFVLSLTGVPEPPAGALMALGLASLLFARRARRAAPTGSARGPATLT